MDIKLKMGAKTDLPSSKNNGTVYFAKDGDKNFGELYYDDENGNRVKIGGSNITSANFAFTYPDPTNIDIADSLCLVINMEDGSQIRTEKMPTASLYSPGLMAPENQQFFGMKAFYPGIAYGLINESEEEDFFTDYTFGISMPGELLPNNMGMNHLSIGGPLTLARTNTDLTVMHGMVVGDGFIAFGQMSGSDLTYWAELNESGFATSSITTSALTAEEVTADSIHSTMFTGAFAGDLEGTARDATSWTNAILLNGTEVKGGETGAITTAKWGAERNISISSAAGTTGTIVDGSNEDGYTLIIPATMTGFTSITSTNLLATNLGAAGTPIGIAHFKETYFHNPNNNNYKHKLTSNAGSAGCELQLPNTSGLIVTKASTTTAVGGLNAPVFVAASGEVTACSTISVEHGGTGSNSLSAYSLLYGNGTNAVGQVTPMAAGRILVSGGPTSAPLYASPSLSFSTGASNPTISFVINGATYTSTNGIQSATGENPGLVSTGTQTFAGAKTFTGAVNFNAGITSTTGTFSGQINATNIKLSGQLKSHSAGTSYLTLTDTKATVTSPIVYLNGTTIVLNSSNYGPTLPTTNLEEGRIFFLLT